MNSMLAYLSQQRARRREALVRRKQEEAAARRAAAYERIPALARVEEERRRAVQALARLAVRAPGQPAPDPAAAQALQQRLQELAAQEQALLRQHGIDPADLEPRWDCPACKDTGWITPDPAAAVAAGSVPPPRKCACLLREELEDLCQAAGLRGATRRYTFEAWDDSIFPPRVRESARLYRDECQRYADRILAGQRVPNLCLQGRVGRGKTFLACAIANRVIQGGKLAVYAPVDLFVTFAQRYKFEGDEYVRWRDFWLAADVAILDDLGVERRTDFVLQELFTLVNSRCLEDKPLVVVTNVMDPRELEEAYTARLVSRILFGADWLRIPDDWPDLRRAALERQQQG